MKDGTVIEPYERLTVFVKGRVNVVNVAQSINTRNVDYDVDHVATQFVTLHVHWRRVCGNVDFA